MLADCRSLETGRTQQRRQLGTCDVTCTRRPERSAPGAAVGIRPAIGVDLVNQAFGPSGRLAGPSAVKGRAGRDPGTVRWRACGTSPPAWSPPDGRRRCARGCRSGADSEPSDANPRSRRGPHGGGRLSARPACRLSMVSGGPYTAVPITRKSPGHARVKVPRQISHPSLTPPRPGRAGPVPSLSPRL